MTEPSMVKASPLARRIYGLPELAPVGILIQLDGQPLRVDRRGEVAPVLPGGWPRPGLAHSTARRRVA